MCGSIKYPYLPTPLPKKGYWKSQGGGGAGALKAKICNGKFEPKHASREIFVLCFFFLGRGVLTKKNPQWEGYEYFLEQYNMEEPQVTLVLVIFTCVANL